LYDYLSDRRKSLNLNRMTFLLKNRRKRRRSGDQQILSFLRGMPEGDRQADRNLYLAKATLTRGNWVTCLTGCIRGKAMPRMSAALLWTTLLRIWEQGALLPCAVEECTFPKLLERLDYAARRSSITERLFKTGSDGEPYGLIPASTPC
jgi:hypothetical protein